VPFNTRSSARVGTIGATVALDLGGSIGATPLGAKAPAVGHLLEFLDRPAWQRDALCREHAGRVNFFLGRGESVEPARPCAPPASCAPSARSTRSSTTSRTACGAG